MTSGWGYIARATIRRRWVGLVVVGLVIGVAAGGVIGVAAAGRRTSTAYDRLAERTLRYDLAVQDDTDGAPLIDAVAELPGVAAYDRLSVYFGLVGEEELLVTGGSEGAFGYSIDRPLVVDGRLPDPTADDEVLVNQLAADTFGLEVGGTVDIATLSMEELEAVVFGGQGLDGPPSGPLLHLQVVGVGKIPDDLDAPDAASIVPPPVIERLATADAGGFDNLARVRLADLHEVDAFTAALEDLPGHQAEQVYVTRGADDGQRVSDATRVESVSTSLLALAAGVALAFVVALVIARSGADEAMAQRSLAACGLDRRARAMAYGLPLAAVGTVAAITAVPVALALSTFFPIGVAGRAEPDPGLDVDATVLLAGIGLLLLVVLVAAGAMAWRASTDADPTRHGGATSAASGDALARNLPLGPAASMGVRLALSPGSGPATVPARSAIVSLALGVAGVTAVLVFAASLDRLVVTPNLYGVTWDLTVSASDDADETGALREQLLADGRVEGLLESTAQQVAIGDLDIPVAAVTSRRGDLSAVFLDGRPPTSADEIALGPLEQRDLQIGLGDRVELPGPDGPVTVTVVGTVLVPVEDDEAGRGATMTAAGLERTSRSSGFTTFLVDLAPSADLEAFAADLGAESEVPQIPTSIDNLARAKGVPRLLAGFLALLGIAGVIHALAVTAGRRRRDLWTLRAIGLHRGQLRSLFNWQAATIALIGVTIGLALGVAAGRTIWRFVADGLGVVTDPADITPELLGGAVATVALLTAIGALIGLVSARWIVARPPRQE